MNNGQYDVCIVGTGAAGGILAYRLAKAGLKVVSIEQGASVSPDDFSNLISPQNKHFGITQSSKFPIDVESFTMDNQFFAKEEERSDSSLSKQNFRNWQIFRLNGKLNLWNAVSFRFTEEDFDEWPIKYHDLKDHYAQIEALIGVTGHQDGINTVPDGIFIPPKPYRPVDKILLSFMQQEGRNLNLTAISNRKAIETRPERKNCCPSCGICIQGCQANSVYKFSNYLLPEIAKLGNYKLITCGKCTSLVKDANGQIKSITYLDINDLKYHSLEAKVFIISAGAIETPRILLNSNLDNGLVGCYLQDNTFTLVGGTLSKLWFNRQKYDIGYSDNLMIVPTVYAKAGQPRFMGHWNQSLFKESNYINVIQSFPQFMRPWIAKRLIKSVVSLVMFGPSDPVKSNCLKISNEKDKYGIPKVDISFQHSLKDQNHLHAMGKIGKTILKGCSGKFVSVEHNSPGSGIHYAGTCRMSKDPDDGVVNANLRSFDYSNLFICDGSVLPNIPERHLTLTIMALANRLSDHLIEQFV